MEWFLAGHLSMAGEPPAWDVRVEVGAAPPCLTEQTADHIWNGTFADGRPLQVRRLSRSWFEARIEGGGWVFADMASGKAVIRCGSDQEVEQGGCGWSECFLAMMQLAMAERGRYIVHAGCVAREGRALLLLGESGAGKTTLSLALARSGWEFMGDDIIMVEDRGGQAVAHALLLPAKVLRPGGKDKDLVPVAGAGWTRVAHEAVIAGVARLSRDGESAHRLDPADRRQTLLWMLEQGNDAAMYGPGGLGWFEAAARVAETARGGTWRVGRLDGTEQGVARAAVEASGG